VGFQRAIWQLQLSHYQQAVKSKNAWVFLDRGIPDSFAYLRLTRSYFPKDLHKAIAAVHYDWVFILDELPSYTQDSQRTETPDEARRIGSLIRHYYRRYGYEPIPVKFDTVENRKMFILNTIKPL
jgi:predicted ATPase